MTTDVIQPGRCAVITGAAKGLGASLARHLAAAGMALVLFDRDQAALKALAEELGDNALALVGDITQEADVARLADTAFAAFGEVALVINNAGISQGAGPWDALAPWRQQLEANLFSMVAMQHHFVPKMMAQAKPSAIVNLGSKEGITTPPGNAAYSVAKAGVKVLTEQLAHELRQRVGDKVTAHLFVPGYTWTPMNFPGMDEKAGNKPDAPWHPDQTVQYFLTRFKAGDFYILCPDNEVTTDMDNKRIRWAMDDIIENRPALSRWHPDWQEKFKNWMAGE